MAQYGGGPRTGGQMWFYIDASGTPLTDITAALAASIGVCPAGDVSIDDTRNTADLKYRCADVGYGLPAKRNPITADFRLVFGIDATLWTLLKGAYSAAEVRWCFFLSDEKTESGATGLALPMFISAYPHDQPLEDVAGHDITMMFGYMEDGGAPVPPAWFTVV